MKKFIKNNIAKILIALSLCLTFALSFAFIPKTYAAEQDNNGYTILPNGIQSKNIFNYNDILRGYEFQGLNPVSNPDWFVSGYVPVSPNNIYYLSGKTSGQSFITYDSSYNAIRSFNILNGSFTANSIERYIRFNAPLTDLYNIMFNLGDYALNYFPYGFFEGFNEYDWNETIIQENEELKQQLYNIPKNYFTYIIGNNYFANSNFVFNQRLNNFIGTLRIGSAPLDTPNTFIEGNKLYLSQLFNYSYNNSKSLDNNFNYVNVYNAPGYSTSNFTYLSLFPHYNLPSNVRSGMAMPLKYVNIIIDGSNYNGSIRLTTQIPNGTTPDTYQYIDISKNSDNNFIINYPDSDNYLISIDIQATYSNGSYNIPTEIISNVEQVSAVSDYQIGYDTAASEYGNIIAQNTNAISNLNDVIEQNNQTIATLRQRVNDLQDQVNNNFGFQNVFFAMADTPFKTVSNFLGFELFGVNLFQALIGFITVLACIWLIKKLI